MSFPKWAARTALPSEAWYFRSIAQGDAVWTNLLAAAHKPIHALFIRRKALCSSAARRVNSARPDHGWLSPHVGLQTYGV